MGFAPYFRRFIFNFSTIAQPLTHLTKKKVKFRWDDECQASFEALKQLLTSTPVLSYPIPHGHFILDTDASAFGLGAVLSQVQNGTERVIAYASKALSNSQRQYCTTHRELLAVVVFLKHFRYYLWGRKFTLRTDHASLKWLLNFKDVEGMLARWLSVIFTYDFEIQHRVGSKHGNADGLSRRPRRRCHRDDCHDCTCWKESQNGNTPKAIDNSTNLVCQRENINAVQTRSGSLKVTDEQTMSWLTSFSCEEIAKMQDEDPAIHKIKNLMLTGNEKPEWSLM